MHVVWQLKIFMRLKGGIKIHTSYSCENFRLSFALSRSMWLANSEIGMGGCEIMPGVWKFRRRISTGSVGAWLVPMSAAISGRVTAAWSGALHGCLRLKGTCPTRNPNVTTSSSATRHQQTHSSTPTPNYTKDTIYRICKETVTSIAPEDGRVSPKHVELKVHK